MNIKSEPLGDMDYYPDQDFNYGDDLGDDYGGADLGGVGADYEEFHPDLEAEDDEKPLASLKKKKKRGRPPLEDEEWQAKVPTYGLLRFN